MSAHALVVGWFSFEQMGASAGDLIARDLVCDWLRTAGWAFDVAAAPPFSGDVDWRHVEPDRYGCVVFVCGPFGNGPPLLEFFERFHGCRMVGVNLTMLEPLDEWNPFQQLWERDSSRQARPDIVMMAPVEKVPVVGLVLIDAQPEHEGNDLQRANEAIARLVRSREMARVVIDTRLDENRTGLRTPAEVESLIARMDVAVTTRLHGAVMAIKHGVPPLVIDSVRGGAKVSRQAASLGWPICLRVEDTTDESLLRAFEYCLTNDARAKARQCRDRAVRALERTHASFVDEMNRLRVEAF